MVEKRRRLGTFYTPSVLARKLVKWALAGTPGTVLDPSFGGCSFLDAALVELTDLGVREPLRMIVGVDIDPDALKHADHLLRNGMPRRNITIRDFFTVNPSPGGDLFDCVVGNPPYVRHHWISSEVKDKAAVAAAESCPELNGRASLWTYFTVHARSFLRPGGRMAFLLPGSVLDADYAVALRRWLRREFATARLIELPDRVFDAEETTVVLLATGAGEGPGNLVSTRLPRMSDLDDALAQQLPQQSGSILLPTSQSIGASLVDELAMLDSMKRLRDLARVRIGVVTGANSFFVKSTSDVNNLTNPEVRAVPIVSRSSWLRTATWIPSDHRSMLDAGRKGHLLMIDPEAILSDDMAGLVQQAEEQSIHERFKCAERTPWYSLRDSEAPQAFLPYMGATPPHIVLNRSHATSTNAVHRVWWKSRTPRRAAAIATWTTLWRIACEQGGRRYGGGVLKIEPGLSQAFTIPIVPAAGPYLSDVDELARMGRHEEAEILADRVVLVDGIGISKRDLGRLRKEAKRLQSERQGSSRRTI